MIATKQAMGRRKQRLSSIQRSIFSIPATGRLPRRFAPRNDTKSYGFCVGRETASRPTK